MKKLLNLLKFISFYIKEVMFANLRIARDILSPTYRMRPGVIAIPLEIQKDMEILAMTNLITMTPGTLSLDVSTDRKVIYIHAMYIDDPEITRREIKEGLESKIMEVSL